MVKFIVLSDLHLVPEGQLSYGIDTFGRAERAIAKINENHADAAFVVFAGDIADHGAPGAYVRFAALRNQLQVPSFVTMGNHDDRQCYLAHCPGEHCPATGRLDHMIDAGTHRVIVLDTLQSGEAWGWLEPVQLDWLAARLDEVLDRPVIVVLHHNPSDLSLRTDAIRLKNVAQLVDTLKRHPRVEQIISGHVHLTTAGSLAGMPFCTLGGNHFAVAPVLKTNPRPTAFDEIFLEGPSQFAVVLGLETGVVVHFENYTDCHEILPIEQFRAILLPAFEGIP